MLAPSNAASLQLSAVLSKRLDGPWRLTATAAGVGDAIDATERALSAQSIDAGTQGAAGSAHALREDVEALAALDPKRLVTLSSRWRAPRAIDGDRFWCATWEAALRHLVAAEAIRRTEADVPELANEVATLWPRDATEPLHWRDLVEELGGEMVSFATLRRWAARPLAETSLSEADISETPPLVLRLLRGRTQLLDPSARRHVAALLEEWDEWDPFEAAVIAETCQHVAPEAFAQCTRRVSEAVPQMHDARSAIPLVYVLLGRGWKIP